METLDHPWCCLTCYHKMKFGKLIAADVLRCPECNSSDIYPIHDYTSTHLKKD